MMRDIGDVDEVKTGVDIGQTLGRADGEVDARPAKQREERGLRWRLRPTPGDRHGFRREISRTDPAAEIGQLQRVLAIPAARHQHPFARQRQRSGFAQDHPIGVDIGMQAGPPAERASRRFEIDRPVGNRGRLGGGLAEKGDLALLSIGKVHRYPSA